ncbi:hypothetical protein LTR36_003424 [Oleoguttula mirabilis]|uniref:Uncharacterized protein n=1 Tax=Oleoguttula mirabilis TaxID=1507867 RepID=A0AAV9JJE1_9PEZI|nr:hypothetical protein LTR36_003424 [Oleoguttula mirabilis]
MSNTHLSATPMDPYTWRESVLSTRSLSFLSTADALGSPRLGSHSRNVSLGHTREPMRRNTMTDDSDYDLEMGGTNRGDRGLNDIPELPDSVAESALFTLPREIRDRVYSFCLTAQNGVPVEWPSLPGAKAVYDLQPQLLRTCKIIRDEAAPMLFSLNNLTFHHPSDANMFVRAMATPALSRRYVTHLSLHVKATDTRLWMPYLMSTDEHRSLKADFLGLREVAVRYRSNKWNHSLSPDQNLKNWSEDSRLDEIIDGLRHVFLPPPPSKSASDGVKPLNEMNEHEFMRFVDARRPGEDMAFKRQLLELHKAHAPAAARAPDPPAIKVVCACRVHSAHFNLVVSASSSTGSRADTHRHHHANGTTAAILASALGPGPGLADSDESEPPAAVQEGEPFRGFTAIDFGGAGVKRLHDPIVGSAKVATTPFADRNGVLVALEIHCLDPKRDGHGHHHRDA